MNAYEDLQAYEPQGIQERSLKRIFIDFLKRDGEKAFLRENLTGHFTASAIVLNDEQDSILLLNHKKLKMWIQPGGHADGEDDLFAVAQRELEEETGIQAPVSLFDGIFRIDRHIIPQLKEVPSHFHYDFCYLFKVSSNEIQKNEESTDLAWFLISEIEKHKLDQSIYEIVDLLKTENIVISK